MKHFIFDYETLGQSVFSCPIIDCAYLVYDFDRFLSDNPYSFEELIAIIQHDKVSVEDQTSNYGYKIEKSTLEWWGQQSAEVRARIKPKANDMSLREHFVEFTNYIYKEGPIKAWWSRANTFDPIIAQRIARDLQMDQVYSQGLPYSLVRDTRTFIDAKTNFAKNMNSFIPARDEARWNKLFQQHNCVHDIAADVLRMQALLRFENDLEIPD